MPLQPFTAFSLWPFYPAEQAWACAVSATSGAAASQLPWWLSGKDSACHTEDSGSIPGLGRSPGEGKGCPLRYPGLQNSMDCIVHGVAESDATQ